MDTTAPTRSPHCRLPLELQRLVGRSYHQRQKFLADPCNASYVLVYDCELNSETYRKILVRETGEIVTGFNMPPLLWLGVRHTTAAVTMEKHTLQAAYNVTYDGELNAWWEVLRAAHPCLPPVHGDMIFSKPHTALAWSVAQFCEEFANWVPAQ